MKRQIDPNLNNNGSNDILFDITSSESKPELKKKDDFSINDVVEREEIDPKFKVISKPEQSRSHHHHSSHHSSHHSTGAKDEKTALSEVRVSDGGHHHSIGEHHSSGSHHSSDGHHHSSGSHHSSSGHHRSSGHHHHSRKKKKKLPLAARIAIAIVLILLLIVLVVTGTFFYLNHKGKQDLMPAAETEPAYQETIEYKGHTYKYNNDIFAVAFLGVDQDDLKASENTDFVGAADTDIVLTVDTKTGSAKAIVVPRDTMVDVDIFSPNGIFLRTQQAQLCLAYAYGYGGEKSCQNSITSISRVLYDVPINKYFALDLNGIAPLNDAVGGITVEAMFDLEDYGIKRGETVTLKGEAAREYVRRRDMHDINASLNRSDRQVQYIKAYTKQVVPTIMKDFSTVRNLYKIGQNYSETNFSVSNATFVASLLLQKGVSSFDTYTIKGTMKASDDPLMENVVHAEFTPDEDSLMEAVLAAFYTQID